MAPDPDDRASAALAAIRAIEQAADPAPWTVSARHGVDIADEGWSEVSIVTGDGAPVALTFLSHILEPGRDDENTAFIAAARTAMPRLLAAVEAVLELHKPADRGTGAQCKGCATHVTFTRWPCPTYLAITSALTGPEETVDHRTEAERRAADEALEALRAKLAGKG